MALSSLSSSWWMVATGPRRSRLSSVSSPKSRLLSKISRSDEGVTSLRTPPSPTTIGRVPPHPTTVSSLSSGASSRAPTPSLVAEATIACQRASIDSGMRSVTMSRSGKGYSGESWRWVVASGTPAFSSRRSRAGHLSLH